MTENRPLWGDCNEAYEDGYRAGRADAFDETAKLLDDEAERLRQRAERSYRTATVEGALDDGSQLLEMAERIRARKADVIERS